MCFSDLDGVENRFLLYKSDKEFNEKKMLEESVLDHCFWIDMFKVNIFIIIEVDRVDQG